MNEVHFLRKEAPHGRPDIAKGLLSVNRKMVMYGLIFLACGVFSLILYAIAARLPEPGIGLRVVSIVSAVLAIAAFSLLVLTIIVRHRIRTKGPYPEPEPEPDSYTDSDAYSEPEGFYRTDD